MKRLLEYSLKLKHLERTGWIQKNIKNPETVASHSYQMALMALYLSKDYSNQYDFNKVIKMCICHDLAESCIGDITPKDVSYKNKRQEEAKAMQNIANGCCCDELYDLYIEYEQKETNEAKLANDLDKLDMYIQSIDYEQKNPNLDLSEFRVSATKSILTPLGKELLASFKK